MSKHLPSFVINHGVVTPVEVQKLLNESMVSKSVCCRIFFSFYISDRVVLFTGFIQHASGGAARGGGGYSHI